MAAIKSRGGKSASELLTSPGGPSVDEPGDRYRRWLASLPVSAAAKDAIEAIDILRYQLLNGYPVPDPTLRALQSYRRKQDRALPRQAIRSSVDLLTSPMLNSRFKKAVDPSKGESAFTKAAELESALIGKTLSAEQARKLYYPSSGRKKKK